MAIDASMLGTHSACGSHLLPERFTGPVDTDAGISFRDSSNRSELRKGVFLQVDCLQRLAVLRLEITENNRHAAAYFALPFVIRYL
jgi:hypothetical protein